jgi:cation diffusion facilitator CzcD-associated flavoprotein CzcO
MKGVGLKYVVIEKNASIGENWTNRYSSVKVWPNSCPAAI